jgi:hypothetical protein
MNDQAPAHQILRGILVTCEQGHSQQVFTPNMPQEEARSLAGLLDGTHPLLAAPPRAHPVPGSTVGRCEMCGAWLTCALFGYEESPDAR